MVGTTRRHPLPSTYDETQRAVLAYALPLETLLRVVGELGSTGGGYRLNFAQFLMPTTLRVFRDLKDEGRAWAIEQANGFPTDPMYRGQTIKAFIFLGRRSSPDRAPNRRRKETVRKKKPANMK
ncbi:MAG: hypothetical protein ACXVEE_03245 [Polyangiales bacterium]